MSENVLAEITTKAAELPLEAQQEVLSFVEFKLQHRDDPISIGAAAFEKKPPFRSVRGLLKGEFPNLEEDIAEMRREAWQNFPRDFPTEENK